MSLFGSFGAPTLAASTTPLPTSLAEVVVTVDGVEVPLYFVSDQQINAQMPWDALPPGVASGRVTIIVERDGLASRPRSITARRSSPGIFTFEFGSGPAIAFTLDGQVAQPTGSIAGIDSQPVSVGEVMTFYATGLGDVDFPIDPGATSEDRLRHTIEVPTVLLGGRSADVLFAGLSPQFVGVNQINVIVPDVDPGDAVPLQIRAGGVTTNPAVTVAVAVRR